MDDSVCFVQFLHPGGEHGPDDGLLKRWNDGPHRRKFLIGQGQYLQGGVPIEEEVVFWGEWEAPSEVRPISAPPHDGPNWLHRPFLELPTSYRGLQNTDPFVFGDQFHYTGCLQHTKFGPTQLRNMSRGSVILFGSCLHRSTFVVDTVFGVADFVDHSLRDYRDKLQGRISDMYDRVTIAPWYANTVQRDKVHRLYFGATFDNPVDGMFSFVPCRPTDEAARGFARPDVFIPGLITPSQTQNKKLRRVGSSAELKPWWEEVVRQVEGQGLSLGTRIMLPLLGRSPGSSSPGEAA